MPGPARGTAARRHLLLALAASAVALFALLLPLGEHSGLRRWLDLGHVPLFALLVWLWLRALEYRRPGRIRTLAWVLPLAFAIAIGSELIQHWIPYRWPDSQDIWRNLLGVGIGVIAWLLTPRARRS